jgi:hypothetical protein
MEFIFVDNVQTKKKILTSGNGGGQAEEGKDDLHCRP